MKLCKQETLQLFRVLDGFVFINLHPGYYNIDLELMPYFLTMVRDGGLWPYNVEIVAFNSDMAEYTVLIREDV